MTKEEALISCMKQWQWLAENPMKNKADYFAENNIKYVCCGCFLCEYRRLIKSSCVEGTNCLLYRAWPLGCVYMTSPYMGWSHATIPTMRQHFALKIVEACRLALEELNIRRPE